MKQRNGILFHMYIFYGRLESRFMVKILGYNVVNQNGMGL